MKGRGKREIPLKTRRPTASSIPTCENPVTQPGIEPGSPWWETSRLTTQSPTLSAENTAHSSGMIRVPFISERPVSVGILRGTH
ncbi:hypothetical protein PR048_023366 [Dryococelus australis]|uniref:Uncharacterized protein n=1 Tax=Dryococelus australis TaxID=614101 RepID=A0ABQ9GTW0_9NEOP|nr:hypothetical protein PR048_023366 [Dryococelus australis]